MALSDPGNDGTFEAHGFYDAVQWAAAGYDDDDSFRKYWNAGVTFDWDE